MKLQDFARVVGFAVFVLVASGCSEQLPSDDEIKSLISQSEEMVWLLRRIGGSDFKLGRPLEMGCTPEAGAEFEKEIWRLIEREEISPAVLDRKTRKYKTKFSASDEYKDKIQGVALDSESDTIRFVNVYSHAFDFIENIDKSFSAETNVLTVEYSLGLAQTEYGKHVSKLDFGKNGEEDCLTIQLTSELGQIPRMRATLEKTDSGWRVTDSGVKAIMQ